MGHEDDRKSDDAMSNSELKMKSCMDRDDYLKEKAAQSSCPDAALVCYQRMALWRQRADLLGSVEAVQERFEQVSDVMSALETLASALSAAGGQAMEGIQGSPFESPQG